MTKTTETPKSIQEWIAFSKAVRVELNAAIAILLDDRCAEETALPHLLSAWETTLKFTLKDPKAEIGFLNKVDPTLLPFGKTEKNEAFRNELLALSSWVKSSNADHSQIPKALRRHKLLKHCRILESVLKKLRGQSVSWKDYFETKKVWGPRITASLTLAFAIVVSVIVIYPRVNPKLWRAAYYPNKTLSGTPVVMGEKQLQFIWEGKSPVEGIGNDNFSARYDTCVDLNSDSTVSFSIAADDGARLFIDGEKQLDEWGEHALQTIGNTFFLKAGVHHLRVEYFQNTGPAQLSLDLNIAGESSKMLTKKLLYYPGKNPPESDICRDVRVSLNKHLPLTQTASLKTP